MTTTTKYPTGREYRDALFNTHRCFKDPALVSGIVTEDALGLPKPISGASGSVFTVRSADGRRWAVKCFTRSIEHQAIRYQRISETISVASKPWRVEFEYLSDGILCSGKWYPVLKREWIEATSFIPFIEKHLWEPAIIADLAIKFARMTKDLSTFNIAHGDLQHGNLLVAPSGELKLIDYDGMFVPSLARVGACEKGHVNYQSPTRTMSTWGPYLDNFSAWVIYTSLVALTIDPTLWSLLHNPGDEALLFRHSDYQDPRNSRALLALAHSSKPALRALGTLMCNVWTPEVRAIPPLNPDDLPQIEAQSSSATLTSSQLASTTVNTVQTAIPDWVTDAQTFSHTAAPNPSNDSSWVTGHLPPLPVIAFSSSQLPAQIIASVFLTIIAVAILFAGLGHLSTVGAGTVSLIAMLVFIGSTIGLFRKTPEWRVKHDKAVILKECRTEATRIAREAVKLAKIRQSIDDREQESVGGIDARARKARSDEARELANVNSNLASRVQHLQKQLSSLKSNEDRETANTLRLLQEHHIESYLSSSSIQSAKISGIGPGIIRSLTASGVVTAADFAGVSYSDGQRILILLRNGTYVHPNGVGEKKAHALDSWRRTLEMQARATQPSWLPPAQAQAISAKYAHQKQNLTHEERTAHAHAQDKRRDISQRWMQNHASISAELVSVRQGFAQERTQTDVDLTNHQSQASAATWQRDLASRETSAYRNVSYLRYLAGIIRVLH
jgi:hypothetical protein